MTQPALLPEALQPVVLSASRRTDLVGCYPDFFLEKLREYPPPQVHSIILWTKNPRNMLLTGELRTALERYGQLYVQLTVTGLGGTVLEPRIPDWKTVLDMAPALIDLAGDPRRVCWRFDPILRCETPAGPVKNIELFPQIAERMAAAGVSTRTPSWVEPYRKVLRRLEQKGIRLMPHTAQERDRHAWLLEKTAAGLGMSLKYCCVEGRSSSACIDGALLNRLHPCGAICSTARAKGQRRLCRCTESIDIGWYSQKCAHGCLYCYAEPMV